MTQKKPISYVALALAVLAFVTLFFDAVCATGEYNKMLKDTAKQGLDELDRYADYYSGSVLTDTKTVLKAMKSGGFTMLEIRGLSGVASGYTQGIDTSELKTFSAFVLIFFILTILALAYLVFGIFTGKQSAGLPLCAMMLIWLIMAIVLNIKMDDGTGVSAITFWPFAGLILGVGCAIAANKSAKA